MKLAPNFDSKEFNVHEPFPSEYAKERQQLAQLAQYLRDIAGSYGRITSAWRSRARNEEVGGSPTSQHPKGEAIDIVFPLASMRRIAARVLADKAAGRAPAFGQIIFYPDLGHIHISLARLGPRNGETLYRVVTKGVKAYKKLDLATLNKLPALSQAAMLGVAAGGTAVVVLFFSAALWAAARKAGLV